MLLNKMKMERKPMITLWFSTYKALDSNFFWKSFLNIASPKMYSLPWITDNDESIELKDFISSYFF